MGSVTRRIRRNIARNEAIKGGFKPNKKYKFEKNKKAESALSKFFNKLIGK